MVLEAKKLNTTIVPSALFKEKKITLFCFFFDAACPTVDEDERAA